MPRRATLLLLAAALLTIVIVFLAVECPGRPERPAAQAKELGPALEEALARSGAAPSSVHLFTAGPSEWHIQVILTQEQYAALESRLEEIIRAVPARVAKKEQERRDGSVHFLWDILGGT
jgi:hypothetical protein